MRSRWFHSPRLHLAVEGNPRKPGWLELFYDLIFVAGFIQLGNGLTAHPTPAGSAAFAGAFAAMWISWSGFTYYMNRFTVDDFIHRLMVFAQMFAVGAMAVTAPKLVSGDYRSFALAYAVAQLLVAVFNLRAYLQVPKARAWSGYWGNLFVLTSIAWATAAFAPAAFAYPLMAGGFAIVFIGPLHTRHRSFVERVPNDSEHLIERFGLLTLIVLGESFVKVLDAATHVHGDSSLSLFGQAAILLTLTLSIWWVYFDDIAGSEIRGRRFTPILWWIGHLPLQLFITTTGVAIKKAASFELDQPAPDAGRWLLGLSLAGVLASVAAIDSVTERRQAELSDRTRIGVRAFSAVLLLLITAAATRMTAATFLLLTTSVLAAQVVLDMMMAPHDDVTDPDLQPVSMAERARHAAATGTPSPVARDFGRTVRRGTPNALREDLYFYFMSGGWTRLCVAFALTYVAINLIFAGLYTLRPDCIDPHTELDFASAFFFSVQTLSTIGYGAMAPATAYGDTLVTIEAAIGLLVTAVATGLVFAKVSHPRAKVVFSDSPVITQRNGKPALSIRAGNVRGNEIVDATISLFALCDEFTDRGRTPAPATRARARANAIADVRAHLDDPAPHRRAKSAGSHRLVRPERPSAGDHRELDRPRRHLWSDDLRTPDVQPRRHSRRSPIRRCIERATRRPPDGRLHAVPRHDRDRAGADRACTRRRRALGLRALRRGRSRPGHAFGRELRWPHSEGNCAVVTGATGGIGQGRGPRLPGGGSRGAVGRPPKGALLEALRGELAADGLRAQALAVDLAQPSAVDRVRLEVRSRFEHLDLLVHSAAVLGGTSPLAQASSDTVATTMQINTLVPHALTAALLPDLERSPRATVVFLTSGLGVRVRAGFGPYAMSKFATEALARTFAREWEDTHVRSVLLDPGARRTDLRAQAFPDESPEGLPSAQALGPLFVRLALDSSVNGRRLEPK